MAIEIRRRGFLLGGLASLVAAPAVVRAQCLMPIVPLRWDGLVSTQMIADEAARILHFLARSPRISMAAPWTGQKGVEFDRWPAPDLASLSDRMQPSLNRLAATGYLPSMGCPQLPSLSGSAGILQGAIGEYLGTKVRYIETYSCAADQIFGRIDVGTMPERAAA